MAKSLLLLNVLLCIGQLFGQIYYGIYPHMVLLEGTNADFASMWDNFNIALNDLLGTKYLKKPWEIAKSGNYRSSSVWTSTSGFDIIAVSLYNMQGDLLWRVAYNLTGCTQQRSCWMTSARVLNHLSFMGQDSAELTENAGTKELFLNSTQDPSNVWFAVWDPREWYPSAGFPYFLFSKNSSSAQPLLRETATNNAGGGGGMAYAGCFTLSSFSYVHMSDNPTTLTVEMCVGLCPGYTYVLLELSYKCHCAELRGTLNDMPNYCDNTCPGDSTQKCGTYQSLVAAYTVSSGGSTIVTTEPNFLPTNDIKTFVTSIPMGENQATISLEQVSEGDIVYVLSFAVSINPLTDYTLNYSKGPCTTAVFVKLFYSSSTLSGDGSTVDAGTLPVRCLWVVLPSNALSFTDVQVDVVYLNETSFVNAPLVSVELMYPIEISTTPVTTSTEATTETTTTTTDATTTVTILTTPTLSTTSPTALTTNLMSTTTNSVIQTVSNGTLCLCRCASNEFVNLTTAQLNVLVKKLQDSLRVNKSELSSYVRQKTSAKDDRPSAQGIGYFGAVIIASVVIFFVLMDLNRVFFIFKR